MGLLLFTTCFPLYIFGSAKTEWTISSGFPIFFVNCQLMVRFPNPVSLNHVIVFPQESMIFSRLVRPTFGWARQGLWQEGGWQLVGWDGLLCKGICFGEVFLLDEDLLRLSEWRDFLKVGDSRLECYEGRSSFFIFVLMHCASTGVFVFLYLCSSVFEFFGLCICIYASVYPRLKCCGQVELLKSPSVCWRYLQTCTHTKGFTFKFLEIKPNTFSFKIFCLHLGWERKTPFLPASKVQRLFLRLYLLAGIQVIISRNQAKIKLSLSLLLCLPNQHCFQKGWFRKSSLRWPLLEARRANSLCKYSIINLY